MSRTRMCQGTMTKITGGEHNMFCEEEIITSSGRCITEYGEEKGVRFCMPLTAPLITITDVVVDFRTPRTGYNGEFGFDWLRVDDAPVTSEPAYQTIVIGGYEKPNGTDTNSELEPAEVFPALEKEYKQLGLNRGTPPVVSKYYVPWLNLYPESISNATPVQVGLPKPPFEAELRMLIAVEGTDPPDQVRIVFDPRYFTIDGKDGSDTNPVLITDKAIGPKREIPTTIKIKCIAELPTNQSIKVFAYPKGLLAKTIPQQKAERKIAGKIIVCANKNAPRTGNVPAMKNRKKQKFVLVRVTTNIQGLPTTGKTGTFIPLEKINLQNALHQALIHGQIDDYTDNGGILDLSAVDEFIIKTVGTTKVYGKFIYEKARHDVLFATSVSPANTSDGGLFEDYPDPNAPNQEMFTFLRNRFLAQPGNRAKYANHFTVFCFDTNPYDMVLFPGGGYSGTLGQVQNIAIKNVCLFLPRNDFTLNHEALHGLGLCHTHETSISNKVKFTYNKYETTNIMSYADTSHPANTKITTWAWQWKIIKSNVN
jgi:hypothetical protein